MFSISIRKMSKDGLRDVRALVRESSLGFSIISMAINLRVRILLGSNRC